MSRSCRRSRRPRSGGAESRTRERRARANDEEPWRAAWDGTSRPRRARWTGSQYGDRCRAPDADGNAGPHWAFAANGRGHLGGQPRCMRSEGRAVPTASSARLRARGSATCGGALRTGLLRVKRRSGSVGRGRRSGSGSRSRSWSWSRSRGRGRGRGHHRAPCGRAHFTLPDSTSARAQRSDAAQRRRGVEARADPMRSPRSVDASSQSRRHGRRRRPRPDRQRPERSACCSTSTRSSPPRRAPWPARDRRASPPVRPPRPPRDRPRRARPPPPASPRRPPSPAPPDRVRPLARRRGSRSSPRAEIPRNGRRTAPSRMSTDAIQLAVCAGTANPMPCAHGSIAVVIPTTAPCASTSGPPELPGFTAASVWTSPSSTSPRAAGRFRCSAETTPVVTDRSKPSGFPIASTTRPP